MDSTCDYGKVISVRLKQKTIEQLEQLRKLYSEMYDLEITNSELLKILINKELKKSKKK